MADDSPYLRVTLEGIDITADVKMVDVEDHDRITDKATIVVDDPSETTGEIPREGQLILVDMGWSSEHAVLFEGIIYNAQIKAEGNARQTITITAFDLSYRLKSRPGQPVNHTGTLTNILTGIVTSDPSNGISIGQIELDTDPEFTQDIPLRQTHQTNWDFILELANRYNCRAFVEYNAEASKFYFISLSKLLQGDPMGGISYQGSIGQLINISYERLASYASPVAKTVTTDPKTGGVVTTPEVKTVIESLSVPSAATQARVPGSGQRLDSALKVVAQSKDTPENQRPQNIVAGLPSDPELARNAVIQDPTIALGLRATGECVGTIMLRAKGKMQIDGVASWAVGEWYVCQVNHIFTFQSTQIGKPVYRTKFITTR